MSGEHFQDDLELFVLDALSPEESARVAKHIASCAECRATAGTLAEVVNALPETVEPREPSGLLRDRILATARAERPAERPAEPSRRAARVWILPRLRPTGFAVAALGAAVLVLGFVNLSEHRALQETTIEKEAYRQTATVGRSWYMAGQGAWKGSGGTLSVAPDGSAHVVFHDLKALAQGEQYALWLVSPDGRWTSGASFVPGDEKLQTVDVSVNANGFDRCLVTIDNGVGRPQQGPVVMSWSATGN